MLERWNVFSARCMCTSRNFFCVLTETFIDLAGARLVCLPRRKKQATVKRPDSPGPKSRGAGGRKSPPAGVWGAKPHVRGGSGGLPQDPEPGAAGNGEGRGLRSKDSRSKTRMLTQAKKASHGQETRQSRAKKPGGRGEKVSPRRGVGREAPRWKLC